MATPASAAPAQQRARALFSTIFSDTFSDILSTQNIAKNIGKIALILVSGRLR